MHSMPPDTRGREKILWGVLDSRQLLCCIIGIGVYAVLVFATFSIFSAFSLLVCSPVVIAGVYFALKKVNDIPLPEYLMIKRKYKKTIKRYVKKGGHDKFEFQPENRG
jgi:hypothetical protein